MAGILYGIVAAAEALLHRRRNRLQQRLLQRMQLLCAAEHVVPDAYEYIHRTLFARSTATGKLLLVNARPGYTEAWCYDAAALQSLVLRTEPGSDGKPERIYLDVLQRHEPAPHTLLLFERCGADRDAIRNVHATSWTWEATLRSLADGFAQPVPLVRSAVQQGPVPLGSTAPAL